MTEVIQGDCLDVLPTLEAESVQTVVTSPPYWGLRDYGTAEWEGGDSECDHLEDVESKFARRDGGKKRDPNGFHGTPHTELAARPYKDVCAKCGARRIDAQLGLERTPAEYVANMVRVFRAVWRVLKPDGVIWVNLGDSYASGGCGEGSGKQLTNVGSNLPRKTAPPGLKPKDLCMMPARVAMALQADGWYLRSEIVWHKPNPMPESVTDRPTKSHEMIYLLSKRASYYYNAKAIAEPANADAINDVVDSNDREAMYDLFANSTDEPVSSEEEWSQRRSDMQEMHERQGNGVAQNTRRKNICTTCAREIQRERTWQAESLDTQSVRGRSEKSQNIRQVREGSDLPVEISPESETQGCGEEILRERQGQGDNRSLSRNAEGRGMPAEGNPQATLGHGDVEHVNGSGVDGHQNGTQLRVRVLWEDRSLTNSRSRRSDHKGRPTHEGKYCSCVPELQRPQGQSLRNKRSVWTVATSPFSEAHFATFPPDLIKPCILAGSRVGDTVLDPFAGSGTVGLVATEYGRKSVLIELNPAYVAMIHDRTNVTAGML